MFYGGGLKYCRGSCGPLHWRPPVAWLTGAGAVRAHRPDNILGIHVQIVLSALAPGGRRQPGVIIAPDEGCPGPERGHGRAARGRHVRLHGAGAAADGVRSSVAILMSGIGTLIFFLFVGGRVPSYLGSVSPSSAASSPSPAMRAAAPTPISAWRWAPSSPAAWPTLIGLIVWAVNARAGGGAGWIDADAAGGDRRRGQP